MDSPFRNRSSTHSSIRMRIYLRPGEQKVFCFFESSDGRFTRDGRKTLQKVFECFSAFEVLEERLDGHSGSAKYRSSSKDFRILDDDSHEEIVSRVKSGGFLEFEFGGVAGGVEDAEGKGETRN